MSEPDVLIGIDAGQTVTKAVCFDEELRELGSGSARVPTTSPKPRWVERDMESVWSATATAIRAALEAGGVPGARVRGVGLVGHNDGVYLIDAASRPVRPAITAMDTRAADQVERWLAGPVGERALELTGQLPYAGSPATLLTWLADNEPASLDRTRWALFCKDWLRLRLTGEIATDPSEASASFTAARTQDYAAEALELYGLTGLADRLPPILPSDSIAGRVTAEAAAATGLPAGTPVVTGAHDVDGTAVGTGVVAPGTLSVVAGTFSINQVVSTELVTGAGWQARSFARPGHWLNMATSPSSATNLEWLVETLGLVPEPATYATLFDEAAAELTGPSSVIYHPFLYGSPYGGGASAAFLGLRGWHRRGVLVRALMEGVVLGHRVHVDALREGFDLGTTARLSGGAARSDLWARMYADGLGMTVEVPDCAETGARGAAALAGLGVGAFAGLDEVAATVRIRRTYRPDPARAAVLDAAYDVFVDAADALSRVWARLA